MYILQKQTPQGKRLEHFEDLLQALLYALSQDCFWKLFLKVNEKPAKLLAFTGETDNV